MQREKVIEIRFSPEKEGRGIFEEPDPTLSPRAPVIVVQRNEFLVGEWDEDCFVHPANQQELESAAEEAVRSAFPSESFASNTIRIFTCPTDLASRFDWDWPKRRGASAAYRDWLSAWEGAWPAKDKQGPRILGECDTVRVVRLLTENRYFSGTQSVERPPAIGDIAVICHASDPNGTVLVEMVDEDGMTVWLATFAKEELELVR